MQCFSRHPRVLALSCLLIALGLSGCGSDGGVVGAGVDDDAASTDDAVIAGSDATAGNDTATLDATGDGGDAGTPGDTATGDTATGDTSDAGCDGTPASCACPLGTACDDKNACTTGETCDKDGKCQGGTTMDCTDKNACTTDSCDATKGCVHAPLDNTPCDDANACTSEDSCTGGVCSGKSICTCKVDGDCNDKNPCTADSCATPGVCIFSPVTATTACDDGNACTLGDTCGNGTCLPGAVTSCTDGNVCTTDSCDVKTGCANLANTATCTDGNACTANDTCADKACVGGASTNCNDDNACTSDACDNTTGCTHGAGPNCDDANVCTDDSCDPAKGCVHNNVVNGFVCTAPSCGTNNFYDPGAACLAGACTLLTGGEGCNDNDVCTNDACNTVTGCSHTFNTAGCNDGNACTAADVCVSDKCTGGAAVTCNDNNPCTDDSCDSTLGCVYAPNAAKCDDGSVCTSGDHCAGGNCEPGAVFSCNDNNACTEEFCDPFKGCTLNYSTAACDDGNACTTADTCDGKGNCVGSVTTVNCDDSNPCTMDSCDSKGICTHTALSNGSACVGSTCVDGGFVGIAVCTSGACGLAPAVTSCDDKQACTTDFCNPLQGCLHTNNSNGCNDGNACTTADTCAFGACVGTSVQCDDSNTCTIDSCDPTSGCKHDAAGASGNGCSDGNVCTTKDSCNSTGSCVGSALSSCDDNNPCTTDSCDAIIGCVHQNNAIGCNDGNDCTSGDICSGGKCFGSTAVNCDDQNVCTTDSCIAIGGCQHTAAVGNCDDGNICTANDACSGGACVGGGALSCDDQNVCTDDKCAPGVGCQHFTNTAACSDNNACTVGDACNGGSCLGGVILTCNDNNPCTNDTCDSAKGCVFTPNSVSCDDANVCTNNDVCAGGKCTGGSTVSCDDKNTCTTDSCDPIKGCQNVANTLNCDDGNACTTTDTCDGAGHCIGSGGKNCDDGNPCTVDSCDASSACTHTPLSNGATCQNSICLGNSWQGVATCTAGVCGAPASPIPCDDSQICTTDSCNNSQGCLHANNSLGCDDGNACTGSDTCTGGACVGTVLSCDDNNPCTSDSCNGGCVHTGNSGGPCTDSNVCTTVDTCASGTCVGAGALNCDDNNVCTTDSCDPLSGCLHANNTLACEDGSACTTNDTCASGKCAGGPAPSCDDGNVCTNDSCDNIAGCQHAANNATCDDGDPCTLGDFCANSKCNPGLTPLTCTDGNACTTDACVKNVGCTYTGLPDGTVCQAASCSALIHSDPSTCVAKLCTAPTPTNCDDSLECTSDTCDATAGCSHTTKAYGTACTTGTSAQKYQFCAGTLCTGIEEANTMFVATDTAGALFSIDRQSATGNITAGGYEGAVGAAIGTTTYSGRMTTIAESPLGIQANATGAANTAFYDQKGRLAVGGNLVLGSSDGAPTTMVLNTTNSTWSAGGPDVSSLSRTLRAVDNYSAGNGNTGFIFGGSSPAAGALNANTATLATSIWDGKNWGAIAHLAVSASSSKCAPIANFNVTDIYSAGAKNIFITGSSAVSAGSSTTYVATYDGNVLATCNLTSGLGGVAYTDTSAYATSLSFTTSATLGILRTIHGTSATHMLAGGDGGTLFAFDNGAWTQLTPAPAIATVKWGVAMQVRSVHLSSATEAWVTGVRTTVNAANTPCTDWFVMHGTFGTTWTWDNLILTSTDLRICVANAELVNGPFKVWADTAVTSSVYFVGETYTNAAGTPNNAGPQTRAEVLRIKTK